MKYTRTAKSISFKTRLDHVRIEAVKSGYKIYADGDDREAIYFLGEHQTAAVAEALGMQDEDNFLDLVENAIKAGQQNEVFSAAIKDAKSEYFWMNMDQIDRFMIAGETPTPLSEN